MVYDSMTVSLDDGVRLIDRISFFRIKKPVVSEAGSASVFRQRST